MEIQDYIDMLRPEAKFGTDVENVHLPAEHASAIADLLEGLVKKLDDTTNRMRASEESSESFRMEWKQEKKIASDLREENKILWSALNLATGRVRELWRPDV